MFHDVMLWKNKQFTGCSFLFVKDRPNITILPEVHSKKLIIDAADHFAKVLTVIDSSGKEFNFYATVMLSLLKVFLKAQS